MKSLYARFLIVIIVAMSSILTVRCDDINVNGIVFRGNDFNVDSRTSLIIPDRGKLRCSGDSLVIDFDLKVSRHGDHFGYVCSIGAESGETVSLFLTNPKNSSPFLCMVDNSGQLAPIRKASGSEPFDIYRWNHINIKLSLSGDSVVVSENGLKMFSIKCPAAGAKGIPLNIIFGKGTLSGKSCVDVAPMELRDIHIACGDVDSRFPLARADGDSLIADTRGDIMARPVNHEWIVDKHSRWKRVMSIAHNQKAYPVTGALSTNLYLVTNDRIVKVDLIKQRTSEFKYRQGHLEMSKIANQFMVLGNRNNERLLYYSIDDAPSTSADISRFDFSTLKWNPEISPKKLSSYINSTRYTSAHDSVAVQMFGYGYHAYKREFNKINVTNGQVTSLDNVLKDVFPRYMCASGRAGDGNIILYGGIGNDYGDQEFGTRIFDDLYMLDTRNDSIKCLRPESGKGCDCIAVDNLIYDEEMHTVTGLFFSPFKANTSLILKELDIESGQLRTISDSIPYQFSDVNSSARLIHLPQVDMLYAVTVSRNLNGDGYTTEIYTLQLPVLPPVSMACGNSQTISSTNARSLSVIILPIALSVGVIAIFFMRRKRGGAPKHIAEPAGVNHDAAEQPLSTPYPIEPEADDHGEPEPVKSKSGQHAGISLSGGFKVIDNNGVDITGSFTRTLRQVLILIILYTEKNGLGVSNAQLKEHLWFDKSDESFSNNRSVNIRKLRKLLPEVHKDLTVSTSHGNWKIDDGDRNGLVDYRDVMGIIKTFKGRECDMSPEQIDAFLQSASHGPLLPECHFEWLDSFKAEYSDNVIQMMHAIMKSGATDQNLLLKLVNCILLFDSIDEDAVKEKCCILIKTNRIGSAGKTFERFVKEYETLMNEPFALSFNEFVGQNIVD